MQSIAKSLLTKTSKTSSLLVIKNNASVALRAFAGNPRYQQRGDDEPIMFGQGRPPRRERQSQDNNESDAESADGGEKPQRRERRTSSSGGSGYAGNRDGGFQRRDDRGGRDGGYGGRGGNSGGYSRGGGGAGGFSRGQDNYSGSMTKRSSTMYDNTNFKPKKEIMKTLTLEEFGEDQRVTLAQLHEETRNQLIKAGVQELLPVQQVTYKLFLEGGEIVVKSRTGTGKTLSFLLPLEQLIRDNKEKLGVKGVQAIILEPTRELASQVQTQVEKYTNLKSVLVYGGGVSRDQQMREIRRLKPDILVCTPGRLIDLLKNEGLQLDQAQYQILDEGDKMLDMGFEQDIIEIQKHLPEGETRSMIFSATVPAFIQELATKRLKDPILIDLVGNDTNQVPERIINKAILIKGEDQMFKHVQSYIEANREKKIIIFTETKQLCRDFEKLQYAQFLTLHGDLEQGQRESRLNRYREKTSKYILVATDVAARGLDIDDIDVVIQCGCRHIDSFVHRSGRTGRVGKNGTNVLFFDANEFKFVLDLESQLNIKIEILSSLQEKQDPIKTEEKMFEGFVQRYGKVRQATYDHINKHGLMEKFKTALQEADEDGKTKMIDYLILNYVQQHLAVTHQVGFLTGLKTYSTYSIRIEFTSPQGKRDFQILREDFAQALKDLQIDSSFEWDQDGVTFLADLNADKLHRVKEMLEKRTTGTQTRLNHSIKLIEEIGEEEKKILARRFSNRSYQR